MKGFTIVSLALVSIIMIQCSDAEPVATGYKKSLESGDSEPAGGGGPGPGPAPAQNPTPPVEQPAGGGGDGDAAKGQALIDKASCGTCHPALAKGLAVGPDMIPRLGTALTGAGAGSHALGDTKKAFEPANLKDLEAALKGK